MSLTVRTSARARLAIAATATSLVLVACATGSATNPGDAMDARLAQGTTIAVTIDADPSNLDDAEDAAAVEELLATQADGPLMTIAVDADGAVAGMSLLDAVFVRRAGNDVYLRVDWEQLEAHEAAPFEQDPRQELEQFGLAEGGTGDLVEALAAGEWVGITGISDSAEQLMGSMMGPSEGARLPDTSDEEVQALLEEQDLDSVDAFLDTYVTATGDNPWELTIDGAALQQALDDVASAAGEAGSGDPEMVDDHELPATITGLTLTAEDGVATELRIDLDEFLESVGEDGVDELIPGMGAGGLSGEQLAELAEVDPAIVLTMTDLGGNAAPPADAVTMSMSELMSTMGG